MQDFIEQANKNGITLFSQGSCQFCGANYQRGIFECMENYNNGIELLNFNNPDYQISRFLSVDAHALQHPEIHGRWSNHFHLTRLHLITRKHVKWNYKKSPILSHYLNDYKLSRPNEILVPPKPMERGTITAKELTQATTTDECIELIAHWADEVYQTWKSSHLLISAIADGFLAQKRD